MSRQYQFGSVLINETGSRQYQFGGVSVDEQASSSVTLITTPATYSLTRQASALNVSWKLTSSPASYVITPRSSSFNLAWKLVSSPAVYVISTRTSATNVARQLASSPAAFSMSGLASGMVVGFGIISSPAVFSISTKSSGLPSSLVLSALPAAYHLIAQSASLTVTTGTIPVPSPLTSFINIEGTSFPGSGVTLMARLTQAFTGFFPTATQFISGSYTITDASTFPVETIVATTNLIPIANFVSDIPSPDSNDWSYDFIGVNFALPIADNIFVETNHAYIIDCELMTADAQVVPIKFRHITSKPIPPETPPEPSLTIVDTIEGKSAVSKGIDCCARLVRPSDGTFPAVSAFLSATYQIKDISTFPPTTIVSTTDLTPINSYFFYPPVVDNSWQQDSIGYNFKLVLSTDIMNVSKHAYLITVNIVTVESDDTVVTFRNIVK